ncbi:Ig-like domain-containing protein [Zhenpiania hominis]|uniref:Ig-like domain-containing protein n=1 Tax=Zhenpiania hominis TaxID=2763644 RepID=UPI0039F46E93
MKRTGVLLCLLLMMMLMSASVCFAEEGGLKIEAQYPENGATGTAVENASLKIWFNQDVRPQSEQVRQANEKAIKLVDEKGKNIPIYVAYSPDEEGLMMVLSDNSAQIQGDTEYTLTIDPSFQAASGDTLAEGDKVSFTTLNQSQATTVNMIMMGVMMVGMIFFTSRSMKKQQEKEKAAKGKTETVNPYKEAKRTGKSVEEIVEKDKKNKEKQAAAAAKRASKNQRAKAAKEKADKNTSSDKKRVAGPRPISAAGGQYKPAKKKAQKSQQNQQKKGNTRPKNQTGKQRNTKNKSKKK